MSDDLNFALSLTCAICLDIASVDSAVETSCCHQLYCLPCIETVNVCPSCRKNDLQTIPAYFARRLIGALTVLCPNEGCNAKITRSDLAKHLSMYCQFKQLTCPDPQCKDLKYTRKSFLEHLLTKHEEYLLENVFKLWQKQEATGGMIVIQSTEKNNDRVQTAATTNNPLRIVDDRLERTRNKFGRYARLGSTGKFYCGGRLDGFRCTCCNGSCGPTNGCNCSGCMLLDVQKKQLPHGWLVNRDGASARCSPQELTKFYCGRKVMTHDVLTDGYCGPTNGNQCEACLKLNEQQYRRYGQIWE